MAKKLLALLLLQAVKAQDCSGQGTTWGVGIAPPPEGCGPGSGDGSCNNPSCSSPPCAAPLLGDVGCSTVAGVEDSFNHQEVMKGDSIPTAAHIFGPFEDGFSERQQKTIELWGCSDPTVVYDDGGKDITVTEAAIAKACNIQFPRIEGENYIGIVGPCGGHTKEYHFHRGLGCLYQVVADSYLVPALISIGRGLQMSDALLGATLLALGGSANDFMTGFVSALTHNGDAGATENDESGGHSSKVGVVAGYNLYGKWEDFGNNQLPLLDACGAHFGPTPESSSNVYHYHVQDQAPFTVGCYGPSASNGLVSVAECRALYHKCDNDGGAGSAIETNEGTVIYDKFCPCWDGAGSNMGTNIVELPALSTSAISYTAGSGAAATTATTATTATASTAATTASTTAIHPCGNCGYGTSTTAGAWGSISSASMRMPKLFGLTAIVCALVR